MTISTTSAAVTVQGNGVTTVFSFPFVADQSSDLLVYYNDQNGNVTLLTPAQYTVFINPVPSGGLWGVGGTVTCLINSAPIPVGSSLVIIRAVPDTQEVSIQNQGAFYPIAVEQAIDITELQIQQLAYTLTRTIQVPIGSSQTPLQYLEALIAALITAAGSSPFTGNITTVTSSHVVATTDVSILADATGGALSITLPSPLTYLGRIINVKKIDATGNAVSLIGTVDGINTYALNFSNQAVTLQANGTSWSVF